jgi:hypothetical protein
VTSDLLYFCGISDHRNAGAVAAKRIISTLFSYQTKLRLKIREMGKITENCNELFCYTVIMDRI